MDVEFRAGEDPGWLFDYHRPCAVVPMLAPCDVAVMSSLRISNERKSGREAFSGSCSVALGPHIV